jgi:DNA-directed RNA polymerase subunit RPC12/RpoP
MDPTPEKLKCPKCGGRGIAIGDGNAAVVECEACGYHAFVKEFTRHIPWVYPTPQP